MLFVCDNYPGGLTMCSKILFQPKNIIIIIIPHCDIICPCRPKIPIIYTKFTLPCFT